MNRAVDAQFKVWRDRAEAAESVLKEIAEMPLSKDFDKDERGSIKSGSRSWGPAWPAWHFQEKAKSHLLTVGQ